MELSFFFLKKKKNSSKYMNQFSYTIFPLQRGIYVLE